MYLRRGDTELLDISGLLSAAGTPDVFAAGDVVRFTLKRRHSDSGAYVAVASDGTAPGVTLTLGTATGLVTIRPADWNVSALPAAVTAVYDLELTRAGSTTTLLSGECVIRPDVTV